MKRTVYYLRRVSSDSPSIISACRHIVKMFSGVTIGHISYPGEYGGGYEVEIYSTTPGPALPFYGQLKTRPLVHRESFQRFMRFFGDA